MRCCTRRTIWRSPRFSRARCSASPRKSCSSWRATTSVPLRAALRAVEAGAWQAARCARRGVEDAAAVHVLCAAARRRRPQGIPGAARPRGQRRARRIPQSRAGLRKQADAVTAGLRALDPHRIHRGEARHGDRARRGAGDDGARRQGPGGGGRRAGGHHHRAGRPADPPSEAVLAAGAGRGAGYARTASPGCRPRGKKPRRWRTRARP